MEQKKVIYNQIKYNFTEKFIFLSIDKCLIFIKKINTFVKDNNILLLIFWAFGRW